MENTVNKRILLLKKELGLNDIEFCGRASISTSTLNKVKNGEEVTQKVIFSILNAFSVNKDWINTGRGKMFNSVQREGSLDAPWRDEAFKALKEEVAFYRQLITQITGGKLPSFLRALSASGAHKASLGASA